MTETIKTTEHYYTKDFGDYNNTENNFVANQELTVNITINEYRSLIKSQAVSDNKIKEAQSDRYVRNDEIEKLKSEIVTLKEKLYDLVNEKQEVKQEGD